ncbi:DUF6146 family protein [Psychroflexus lacisalsi]|uniref:DUF6146 family protein n=1 Tax=Psychroflexus lacisalsi TaxID=503928 RepID=A0ABN1KA94_9FLAO|nr:DUF6146 family protein [Psychroflexus lacisalsi]MBZ9619882.1 DUF6146 family protein [Psychroflexus lacisalsi]
MKLFLPLFLIICIISCSVQKERTSTETSDDSSQNDTIRIANDSLEYEIIIFEPGFNTWLVTQKPRGYYNLNYLEQRNRIFVINYNQRVLNPFQYDPNLYPQQINYEYNVDYGYEVNYLLYFYFVYFQQEYGQKLR